MLILGEVNAYRRSLSDYNTLNITSYDTILLCSRHHINGYDLAVCSLNCYRGQWDTSRVFLGGGATLFTCL